jgi:cytochrome c5
MKSMRNAAAIAVVAALTAVSFAGIGRATETGDAKAGETVYNETCIACHGEKGAGSIPGAPDFTKKDGAVWTKSDTVLLDHILHGFQGENSLIGMPEKGGNDDLSIKDLRDVLAYMHKAFHYR